MRESFLGINALHPLFCLGLLKYQCVVASRHAKNIAKDSKDIGDGLFARMDDFKMKYLEKWIVLTEIDKFWTIVSGRVFGAFWIKN